MASEHSIDLHLLSSQLGVENGAQQIRGGVDSNPGKFGEVLKAERKEHHKNQIDEDNNETYGKAGEVSAMVPVQAPLEVHKTPITGPSLPADLTGLFNLLSEPTVSPGQGLPGGGKTLPQGADVASAVGSFISDKFTSAHQSFSSRSAVDTGLTASPSKAASSAHANNEVSLLDRAFSGRMSGGNMPLNLVESLNLETTRTGQASSAVLVNPPSSDSATGLTQTLLGLKIAQENGLSSSNTLFEKPLNAVAPTQPVTENLHQLVSRLRLADSRSKLGEGTRTASATVLQEGQWLASGDAGRQLFATQLASLQLAGSADNATTQVEVKPLSGSQSMVTPYSLPGSGLGASFGKESSAVQFQTAMGAQFGQPAWETELGQHARMMVRENLRLVEIELKPARLGTIEILVTQEKDQTSLMFFTKNPVVRDALEAGLLRLQKSFSEDGLHLENTQVSDQSLSEHREQQRHASRQHEASDPQSDSVGHSGHDSGSQRLLSTVSEGMLDTWA